MNLTRAIKLSIQVFMSLVLLLSSSVFHFSWGSIVMKEQIRLYALEQSEQILNNRDWTGQVKLYQWSMPLLAFASIADKEGYARSLKNMEALLSSETIEPSWALWMRGRMVLSAKLIEDEASLEVLKQALARDLFLDAPKAVMTGWAFAYFAALDDESYTLSRGKLFEYTAYGKKLAEEDRKTQGSNYLWTLVMNLFAAASTGNRTDYGYFLQELKNTTEKNTLVDAVSLVPLADYQQWLVGIMRYSMTVMQDEESIRELEHFAAPTHVDSFDAMLAVTNYLFIEDLNLSAHRSLSY